MNKMRGILILALILLLPAVVISDISPDKNSVWSAGTKTNGAELDKNGDLTLTGEITTQGTGTNAIAGDVTIAGDLTVTGDVETNGRMPVTETGALSIVFTEAMSGYVVITATVSMSFFLPSTGTVPSGTRYVIKLATTLAAAPTMTIDASGSETIDGETTITDIDKPFDCLGVFSVDGIGWYIDIRYIQ